MTSDGRIHLIGGGPGTVRALHKHFRAALAPLGKERPVVAYVGAASGDHRGFFAMITGGLSLSGARFKMAKTASPRASTADAKSLLEGCDLVFMSGGDVDEGMRVLDERGLSDTLRTLARQGKPMFGISAGSIMLAKAWLRFDEKDETNAEIFACTGVVPAYVDAHAEEDDWEELRTLLRLLHEKGEEAPEGYGLTRHGGLHVTLRADGARLAAIGTPAPRYVVRRGRVVAAAPLGNLE